MIYKNVQLFAAINMQLPTFRFTKRQSWYAQRIFKFHDSDGKCIDEYIE